MESVAEQLPVDGEVKEHMLRKCCSESGRNTSGKRAACKIPWINDLQQRGRFGRTTTAQQSPYVYLFSMFVSETFED